MKAIVVDAFGPSEHPRVQEIRARTRNRHVIVKAAYAGINYVDLYQREGTYPVVTLPSRPGLEGSGVVVDAPADCNWRVGDRVAYTTGVQGSHAGLVAVSEANLVAVPDETGLREASAELEHGLTVRMLIDAVARLAPASTVLVHAVAGGVGCWLVQQLRSAGHRVIGTASSTAKLQWLEGVGIEPCRYGGEGDWAGAT